MKVGICVTTHRSLEIRPQGSKLLQIFFDSFRESDFKYDYKIYVSDNESKIPFLKYPDDLNIDINYIENQSLQGLTGAWNNAMHRAYLDGCDIIWNFNDDVELNITINKFIEEITIYPDKDKTVFGPTSNNGGSPSPNTYLRAEPGIKKLDLKANTWQNLPNGFSFAITRTFYENFRHEKDRFFPIEHELNGGDGKWGGQEGYFGILAAKGIGAVIIKSCWLMHFKFRQWETARDIYK